MRVQPPKDWPYELMTEERFDEFISKHVVIAKSEEEDFKEIGLLDFYNYMMKVGKDRFEVAMYMSALFPYSYQMDFLRSLLRLTSKE